MNVDDRAQALFSGTPVYGFLGARLVARTPDRVEVRLTARPEMAQEFGIVQGGILSALADAAVAYLLLPEAMDSGLNGVGFQMNFLRPARADGSELAAIATPVKIGKRIAVCSVDVLQADRLLAQGTFTFLMG